MNDIDRSASLGAAWDAVAPSHVELRAAAAVRRRRREAALDRMDAARDLMEGALQHLGLAALFERYDRERWALAVARGETGEHEHVWAALRDAEGTWCGVCAEVRLA